MTAKENPVVRGNAQTGQNYSDIGNVNAINIAELQAFLSAIRPENHLLTGINPEGGPTVSRHFARTDDPDIARFIAHVQEQGMGVYFSPNAPRTDADRKAKKADIASASVLHVDIDPPEGMGRDEGRAAILARIAALPFWLPAPTVVDSGNGYNVLWKLDQPSTDLDAIEGVNRALAAELGGDPGTWNSDRILRLPGTVNHPNARKRAAGRVPSPARVVSIGDAVSFEMMASAFPPVPAPAQRPDAHASIDFEQVFPCSSVDDLPMGLASRLKAACADDRTLAGLCDGKAAPRQEDVSSSQFRFLIAQRLHIAGGFSDTEIATLLWICDAAGSEDRKTERTLSRDVANSRPEPKPHAADEFEIVPDIMERPAPAKAKPTGFALVRASDMVATEPEFLVHGLVEIDSLALIFGDPGCGKSFLAIDIAACVATGVAFHGNAVRSGPVIYMAGEGHNGLRRRTKAWEQHNACSLDGAPLFFSRAAARFLDKAHAVQVAEAVDAIARTEGPPRLIVVDTLARSFAGGDENATSDMGEFVAAIDALKGRYPSCTVLILHHSGHGDKQRARGAMALKGALDCEYRVELVDGVITVTNSKMKDAVPPAPMTFELQTVEIGTDRDGLAYSSAVLVPTFTRARKATVTSGARLALDAFRAAQGGDDSAPVHLEKWRTFFYERHTGDTVNTKKAAFRRVRELLVDGGYLVLSGENYALTHAA